MASFTHIVSLGYRCRSTRRLRDYFGLTTAFPFDWWISPIEGLTGFLRRWDLDHLYDPRCLSIRQRGSSMPYIQHAEYKIGMVHEFPTDRSKLSGKGYLAYIADARDRTAHLMAKFDKLNRPDRSLLFVRQLAPVEEKRSRAWAELRQAALDRVAAATCTFLLISRSGVTAPGWVPLAVDDPIDEPWSGDPVKWDPAFASLDFRLERRPGWGTPDTPADLRPETPRP